MISNKYKPILIFYIDKYERIGLSERAKIEDFAKMKGYECLIFGGVKNERVEIISVDKATIVEDIQNYIDNIKKEEA